MCIYGVSAGLTYIALRHDMLIVSSEYKHTKGVIKFYCIQSFQF